MFQICLDSQWEACCGPNGDKVLIASGKHVVGLMVTKSGTQQCENIGLGIIKTQKLYRIPIANQMI
jgi:hypothetical protein